MLKCYSLEEWSTIALKDIFIAPWSFFIVQRGAAAGMSQRERAFKNYDSI
jgi:hypothetical protein